MLHPAAEQWTNARTFHHSLYPATRIAAERRATEAVRKLTLWQAFHNPKVLLLALNFLGIVTASLGMQTGDGNVVRRL